MIITCEECSTGFNLDERLLKETGSKVRCSVCKTVFTAFPAATPEEPKDIESDAETAAGVEIEEAADLESDELEDIAKMFEADEDPDAVESEEPLDAEDLDLESDLDADEPQESKADAETGLDLSDPDEDLEPEGEPPEVQAEEIGDTDELDLDLDFEFDEADEPAEEGEELDLAEREDTLTIEEEDLSLAELEDTLALEEEPAEAEAGETEDTEELDLDLDFEFDEADEPAEEGEELDLSDLEEALDSEEERDAVEDAQTEEEEALDLDLDLELDETPVSDEAEEVPELPDFEEETEAVDPDLGESADAEKVQIDEVFEEEALDLSDIEKMIEAEAEPETAAESEADSEARIEEADEEISEDIDDFRAADKQRDTAGAGAIAGAALLDDDEEEDAGESTADDVAEKGEPGSDKKARRKKRIGAPVMVLLILLLVGGGGYGAYVGLTAMGIKIPYMDQVQNIGARIPFLSSWITPAVQDAGNLKIRTTDITGKFLNNAGGGKLFVIIGSAKNEYDDPRALIKINGKLYAKDKQLVKSETVYCGNSLTDEQLSDMDLETIKQRLNNRAGENKSNLNVAPGRVVPFMIVFSGLPENLEEYTIEVVESFPAAKI